MPALQLLDAQGRVLYVGTFAKAMTADYPHRLLRVPSSRIPTMEIA